MYSAQSPHADPVRPSWKNLSTQKSTKTLLHKMCYTRATSCNSGLNFDFTSSESAVGDIADLPRLSDDPLNRSERHADDGHHRKAAVGKLRIELLRPAESFFDTQGQGADVMPRIWGLRAGSWTELPNPTRPSPRLPLPKLPASPPAGTESFVTGSEQPH